MSRDHGVHGARMEAEETVHLLSAAEAGVRRGEEQVGGLPALSPQGLLTALRNTPTPEDVF